MSISELNFISNFEAGVNRLQNPSVVSRFFSLSGTRDLPKVYSFLKWGALILALVATFTGIITRIKLVIVRFGQVKLFSSSGPPTQQLEDEYLYDEDEDDSSSSTISDDEGYRPTTSIQSRQPFDEDFCVAGSSCYRNNLQWQNRDTKLRRRTAVDSWFSCTDFVSGKSSVKLWDNLGLRLDFEENSSASVVSIWDLNKDQKISSFSGGKFESSAVTSSPPVIFSAESNYNNNVLLGVYDTRVGIQSPAIYAEWLQGRGKVVGINFGGVEKVYVRNDVTGMMTVGDMRKVKSPLVDLTEIPGVMLTPL